MNIIISGGGIAGLTLGLIAKKAGYAPIIIQKRDSLDHSSFGGGIGLWPPSQMVMQRLGVLSQLQKEGYYMPNACYYNSQGYILGHPSSTFSTKFPVLCLQRQTLSKSLYKQCQQQGIQVMMKTTLQDVISSKQGVTVKLSNGQYINGKMLVGADGIGSKVRNIIRKQSGLNQILPFHCQYAYFRAVVDLGNDATSQWSNHAFQSWGEGKRFGYVPLKAPKNFWFVAIPIGEQNLQKVVGSHVCNQQQKKWILKQFQFWQAPIKIKKLLQLTPAHTILRTDIVKVKDVTSFEWASQHKNIVILGDAANATAPNLAQGAGLAIESGWDLISMVNIYNYHGLNEYILKRKKRAQTVQNLADLVAKIGQLRKPYIGVRDFLMKYTTYHLKSFQQRIFQQVVCHSVGGDSSKLYWMPPNIPLHTFHKSIRNESSILGKCFGKQQFELLPKKTKIFRSSYVGIGSGRVNVNTFNGSQLFGFPSKMIDRKFEAYCQSFVNKDGTQNQRWSRVFGVDQQGAVKYQTIHRITPNLQHSKTGFILTQTLGFWPDVIRFGYKPELTTNNNINYKSLGIWLKNYKLLLPKFLMPTSQWNQKQTQNGWIFQGQIKLPLMLGSFRIMSYSGTFTPQILSRQINQNKKRVIIAGGTGMIGSRVAKAFYLSGWNVQVLTRNQKKYSETVPYIKLHQWSPSQCNHPKQIQKLQSILTGANLIINLSGQNPGSFWNQKNKIKILQSRLNSIKLIGNALKKLKNENPTFLQASAAGIYGNRNQQILEDDIEVGQQQTFRIQTCKQIQKLTKQLYSEAGIIRIGHVLCSEGGLFPHIQLASKMRAGRFGKGGQYIPWIHIQDLANSMVYIASNFQNFKGKTINAASPNSITYDILLSKLAKMRKRKGCVIPVFERLLKLVLGEMSGVILDSQRIYPKLLINNGFQFKYSDIQKAITSKQCL